MRLVGLGFAKLAANILYATTTRDSTWCGLRNPWTWGGNYSPSAPVPDPDLKESSEAADKLAETMKRSAELAEKMKASAAKTAALADAVAEELQKVKQSDSTQNAG